MTRIGLYGGSFDPPHNAHAALARAALEQLALDELLWLPAGQAWQKDHTLAPAADRVAMLHLLIDTEPRFRLDDRELRRAGPSYTFDTVAELRVERPHAALFLVIGQDQYAGLPSWHRWDALLPSVTLAVAAREGQVVSPPPALAAMPHRLLPLALPPMVVSSSSIRDHLAAGGAAVDLVPAMVSPEVASYIDSRGLYRTRTEPPTPGVPHGAPPTRS